MWQGRLEYAHGNPCLSKEATKSGVYVVFVVQFVIVVVIVVVSSLL